VCDLETSRICTPYIYDIRSLRVKHLGLREIRNYRRMEKITIFLANLMCMIDSNRKRKAEHVWGGENRRRWRMVIGRHVEKKTL
jgi:hypothetical protein